ncbi:MAG: heparinase II/III family protein [Verrucomicrobia bacterium]|nr:heparinase II/III family protein [Verrucomicrobiota bacterium]
MVLVLSCGCLSNGWSAVPPAVPVPAGALMRPHPFLACSTGELTRLQTVLRDHLPGCEILASRIRQADGMLNQPLRFPPRGARHNQWYQCDRCQTALETVDDTHHRCPICKKIYSGPPYDDVIFGRQHRENFGQMTACAWAYALTGKRIYAERVAALLTGYAERYRQYPFRGNTRWNFLYAWVTGGRLYDQTLSEASTLVTSLAPAYDLIHDAGVLTEADHQKIQNDLFEPMLSGIEKNFANRGNWHTWHNAAILWGGALIGDTQRVSKSINDPYDGFRYHLDNYVNPEGMWYENSWGYHFYALQALTAQAEGARRLGVDLWSAPRFRAMFTLPAAFTMADGSLPRFGDDTQASATGSPSLMEPAYHTCHDPAILALLSNKLSWESLLYGRDTSVTVEPVSLVSHVFPLSGYAVLRSRGPANMTVALTFSPFGGFHSHMDKLSFVWFAYGCELAVDPGCALSQAYRLPIHADWYRSTISHNTVMVNGRSQAPAEGALEFFDTRERYSAVAVRCVQAYSGVMHRRLLLLTDRYLLVADELRASKPVRFDWLYHQRASNVVCEAAGQSADWDRAKPGGIYVKNIRRGMSDGPIRARFNDTGLVTHVTLNAVEGTEVLTGDGPFRSVQDRVPLMRVSRRGSAAHFVAVLEPVSAGQTATISGVTMEGGNDGYYIRIVLADGQSVNITWLPKAVTVSTQLR